MVVIAFGAAIAVGTVLLMLPFATESGSVTNPGEALFTATSAVCVTGLVVVDTPTHWSTFGEVVIMVLFQLGGFGIMTLSSLVALTLSRRLGLRQRLFAQAETGTMDPGDVRRVLIGVAAFTVLFESVATVVLSWRFYADGDVSVGRAVYLGLFHAISAFNNAGFSLFSDSLMGFVTDWWLIVTIGLAVIAGGIGFPVWLDLREHLTRPRRWALHTKLTVGTTLLLLVVGTVLLSATEWTNPATLGALDGPDKVLAGWFQAVMPRTAGFNSLDYGAMRESSWLVTDALMLIGGGSASTAGGVKVTTFALLGFVIWSEVRGDPDVNAFGRRIPDTAQRQAVALVLLAVGAVITATFALVVLADVTIGPALFEALSAFSTVGLSTGITGELGTPAQMVLVVLMFLGRVGPITLFAALVLRERGRLYRLPQERPIIG
ncbi:TrkH family potassium uptake protein [Rhabdothermincola salaria]|uniref:TrkH family potassium uptake protein n=1 Tax=Rhabdothermincola salaria TaxID=2903142 RepID=UPI0020171B79|nr:potassium transporter TrkG [Rhabdothermincola salaria]